MMVLLSILTGRLPRVAARHCSSAAAEHPHVVTGRVGAVTTIAINRPEKRNCVSSRTAAELTAALRQFEADDSSPVAVLHGKGGNFCAGYDLAELASSAPDRPVPAGPMGPSRLVCDKPVVAAVDGYAVAGGLELALWCDLRVVEETAVLGVFCRRFGVPLLDGGTVRLPALVGLSRALDMILTGRAVSGAEALQWGLANRLVACGTALGQAVNLAGSIAKFPAACLRADRRSAYHAAFDARALDEALQSEHENGLGTLAAEGLDGARRFLDGIGRHGKFTLHPEKMDEWNKR